MCEFVSWYNNNCCVPSQCPIPSNECDYLNDIHDTIYVAPRPKDCLKSTAKIGSLNNPHYSLDDALTFVRNYLKKDKLKKWKVKIIKNSVNDLTTSPAYDRDAGYILPQNLTSLGGTGSGGTVVAGNLRYRELASQLELYGFTHDGRVTLESYPFKPYKDLANGSPTLKLSDVNVVEKVVERLPYLSVSSPLGQFICNTVKNFSTRISAVVDRFESEKVGWLLVKGYGMLVDANGSIGTLSSTNDVLTPPATTTDATDVEKIMFADQYAKIKNIQVTNPMVGWPANEIAPVLLRKSMNPEDKVEIVGGKFKNAKIADITADADDVRAGIASFRAHGLQIVGDLNENPDEAAKALISIKTARMAQLTASIQDISADFHDRPFLCMEAGGDSRLSIKQYNNFLQRNRPRPGQKGRLANIPIISKRISGNGTIDEIATGLIV
jgi:hypothetical protein